MRPPTFLLNFKSDCQIITKRILIDFFFIVPYLYLLDNVSPFKESQKNYYLRGSFPFQLFAWFLFGFRDILKNYYLLFVDPLHNES